MQSNAYTKGLLLLIALFLGIIACRPSFQSDSALAQNSAKMNIQVLCSSCSIPQAQSTAHLIILDQNTGKVWAYRELNQTPIYMGLMNEIGKPLQNQKE